MSLRFYWRFLFPFFLTIKLIKSLTFDSPQHFYIFGQWFFYSPNGHLVVDDQKTKWIELDWIEMETNWFVQNNFLFHLTFYLCWKRICAFVLFFFIIYFNLSMKNIYLSDIGNLAGLYNDTGWCVCVWSGLLEVEQFLPDFRIDKQRIIWSKFKRNYYYSKCVYILISHLFDNVQKGYLIVPTLILILI